MNYLIKRLLLFPLTLFAIILVNFIILNLAPNEPSTLTQRNASGEAQRNAQDETSVQDLQYLQFREHFGLTLPLFFNIWPAEKKNTLIKNLSILAYEKERLGMEKMHQFKIRMGDKSRYIMPLLLEVAEDPLISQAIRFESFKLFLRGGTKQGIVKAQLTEEEKKFNQIVAKNNLFFDQLRKDHIHEFGNHLPLLKNWLEEHKEEWQKTKLEKTKIFFLETRFSRYLFRVIRLDFGQTRQDRNKSVLSEVARRMKYSLTLAALPLCITFLLCQFFGMTMAVFHNRIPDIGLNLLFLALFAIPVFVAAPFLIEKLALHHTFPFSKTPIYYSGFQSENEIYAQFTSWGKLKDILAHLFLPLIALIYSSLAVQSRLARTAFLEVMQLDYIRYARAKGVRKIDLFIRHIARSASITIVTSLAASLGVVLGGSLIIETLFDINGFGKFFYDAIVQRDYNVVLFSALAGSFLTLVGYLIADLSYTILDPRVTLEK